MNSGHQGKTDAAERVRAHLQAVTARALDARMHLGSLQAAHGDRVHFRPSSTGVAMVGLLPARPQRGKSGYTNLARLAANFEEEFQHHCVNVEQGRPNC
jgi:hypothetical protein